MVQKIHPLELPANTAAAMAYPSTDVVTTDVPLSPERQQQATDAIQEHVDTMAALGVVEDPRLSGDGGGGEEALAVTSIDPTSGPPDASAVLDVYGTGFVPDNRPDSWSTISIYANADWSIVDTEFVDSTHLRCPDFWPGNDAEVYVQNFPGPVESNHVNWTST